MTLSTFGPVADTETTRQQWLIAARRGTAGRTRAARHGGRLIHWLAVGLVVGSLALPAPSTGAAGSDPSSPAPTPEACGRTPSTPTPLRTEPDGLSWEPLVDTLPAVASPSAEEQAYLAAIDEVHARVRTSGSRIGIAMILYSICELDNAALGSRLDGIRIDLDQAAAELAELSVPERLEAVQHNYVQVVHLYQQGVAEMGRATQDGNPEHLRAAFPFTKTASDELASLESLVWAPPRPEVGQPTSPDVPIASSAE